MSFFGRSPLYKPSINNVVPQPSALPSHTRGRLLRNGPLSPRPPARKQGALRARVQLGEGVFASALMQAPESLSVSGFLEMPEYLTGTLGTTERVKKCRLITAIKTPYLENGRIDIRAYDTSVCHQIRNGVEGVIVGGTTGEGHLMTWDEQIMLIAHTVNSFGNAIAVIGNTGSNSTREALRSTQQGFSVGMHASLQTNPYYGKTSHEGLAYHFRDVLEEGPAILYNVPGRTGQDIPNAVVEALAAHPGFLGVKECTGNARIQGYARHGIRCWSGNDDEAHDGRHFFGGQGVISVTSNLIPGLFSKLMRQQDDDLNRRLQDLMAWLFCEPNPIAINTALAMCGIIKPVFRLPYVPLSRPQREHGARLLRAVAEHIPGAKDIRVMEDDEFVVLRQY